MLLKNGQRQEKLPKLKKIAVFELTEAYSHFDKKNQKLIKTNTYFEPASFTKYDEELNDTVEIRYAETQSPFTDATGKLGVKYGPHKIKFTKGMIVVKPTQPDLYEFLMNSPSNEKNGGKKFRLKDPVIAAGESIFSGQQLFEAQKLIFGGREGGLSESDMRRVLLAAGHPEANEYEIEIVKDTLLKIAKADPAKFIAMCKSKHMDVKGTIVLAIKAGILELDGDTGVWRWGKASGSTKDIVKVPQGQNVGEWLTNWLISTDDSGVLDEINSKLNGKAKKPQPAKV